MQFAIDKVGQWSDDQEFKVDAGMTGKSGSAGVSDATTKAGQVDHLTVRPGQASLDNSRHPDDQACC